MANLAVIEPDGAKYNVLAPLGIPAGRISAFHVVTYSLITVGLDETFQPQGPGHALLKSALNRIAAAMGARMLKSGPLAGIPFTKEHFIWQVEIEIPMTGQEPTRYIGSYEWDQTEEFKKCKTEGDRDRTQKFRVRMAESKAFNAAMRDTGIKSKYTEAELKRGFCVPRITYNPDISDPGVVAIMGARQEHNVAALYGPADAPALAAAEDAAAGTDDSPLEPEIVEDVGRKVDTATGEVIEDAEVEPASVDELLESTLTPADKERFTDLCGYVLKFSACKGQTLWKVLETEKTKWFADAVEWRDSAQGRALTNAELIDELQTLAEFAALLKKVG